jgi:tripartite-type tricarboxylate transporter receptor subunit TctC
MVRNKKANAYRPGGNIMRSLLSGIAAVLMLGSVATDVAAQKPFPERPVTILVPAAAGGPSDTVARLVAESMAKTLGQQIVIENIGGAGGSLGGAKVAKAEPDGYTLLLYHIGVATFQALYPGLPYKPGELTSVGLITDVPMTLVGRSDLPAQSVGEVVSFIKAQNGAATFGTAGVGAVSHLCGMLLQQAIGAKLTSVPYKGTGPAMTDLIGKRIDLMCDQTTNTTNQINAKEIRAYAVTTPKRIDILPDVPTLQESGLAGFEVTAWHALWAPKGTPEPIRQTLAGALQKALADPVVIKRFADLGTAPVPAEMAKPAALDQRFQSELARWGKVIADAGEVAK